MVGVLLFKWDLLPSRFMGRAGSCGQQGIPFSLMVQPIPSMERVTLRGIKALWNLISPKRDL